MTMTPWKAAPASLVLLAGLAWAGCRPPGEDLATGPKDFLNVGPTAEGLIPPPSVERLATPGDWMEINGEAIYRTRLWTHYEDGEGVRYTWTGGDQVYAVSLGWPGAELILHRIEPEAGSEIVLLGFDHPLSWTYDAEEGLVISVPDVLQDPAARPCEHAFVLRIKGGPVLGARTVDSNP